MIRLIRPRSSESAWPLLVVDREIKFDFFLQVPWYWKPRQWHLNKKYRAPFGLLIRLPFVWARWGCA